MRGILMAFDAQKNPLSQVYKSVSPEEIKLILPFPDNNYIVVILSGQLIYATRYQSPPSSHDGYIRTIGEVDVPWLMYDTILAAVTSQEELQRQKETIQHLIAVGCSQKQS